MLQLRALAGTDAVTGAYNFERLRERLASYHASMVRFGEAYLVAVLDIDGLSSINRSYGESAGDVVLAEVAEHLGRVAGTESVYRVASDEFAVVTTLESEAQGLTVARLLIDAVQSVSVGEARVSASVGYAVSATSTGSDELLSHASEAQRWAKTHGKGRCVRYDPALMRGMSAYQSTAWAAITDLDLVRGLMSLVHASEDSGHLHSRNTAALAAHLSDDLGLSESERSRIELGAALHDVGKIAVRDIPESPRSHRTSNAASREHPMLGARMVEALGVDGLSECVRAHHERWDGSGYPDGLAGEDIPLAARIVALADAYDAMTSTRVYGDALSKSAALQEIDHGLGTRFDPALGERFIVLIAASEPLGWIDDRGTAWVAGT
jgi:diguanylate cyclase (GGDEF)-like protein